MNATPGHPGSRDIKSACSSDFILRWKHHRSIKSNTPHRTFIAPISPSSHLYIPSIYYCKVKKSQYCPGDVGKIMQEDITSYLTRGR
ncbi:hypothetical protein FKM82_015162 [Ascaphus truei]